jgi:hypothetical protein
MILRKNISRLITVFATGILMGFSAGEPAANPEAVYVGAEACAECHPEQYDTYKTHAKKAKSYSSIRRMVDKLTPAELQECYGCHTTGYRKSGGFTSEQETPHLKDAGCEVCHGPGSLHIESEDPSDLKEEIRIEDCMECHNTERIAAFGFKPLIFGGAH